MSYILIDMEGRCFCNCAMRCAYDQRCGSSLRCTKEEIESNGYKTIQVNDRKSQRAVFDSICIDGKEHKLKIKDVAYETYRRRKRGILQLAKIYYRLFSWR